MLFSMIYSKNDFVFQKKYSEFPDPTLKYFKNPIQLDNGFHTLCYYSYFCLITQKYTYFCITLTHSLYTNWSGMEDRLILPMEYKVALVIPQTGFITTVLVLVHCPYHFGLYIFPVTALII